MATFFVGQRVRIVHVERAENAALLGREARIAEVADWPFYGRVYGLDLYPIIYLRDTTLAWGSRQLEPIVPSGHCAGDFSYQELMDRCCEGHGVAA